MVLPAEGFVANVTRVGPLVRVRSLVDQQVIGLGEASLAELADKVLFRSIRGAALAQRRACGAMMMSTLHLQIDSCGRKV